jgi:phage terminase large subunit
MQRYTGLLPSSGKWATAYINDYRIWRKGQSRPDYNQGMLDRISMMNKIRTEPRFLEVLNRYYELNPVAFIMDWCVTYDPRNIGTEYPPTMPFFLFERQIDLIQFICECLDSKEKGLLEKSRDYGATWICAAMSVWIWKYKKGSSVGWGSRKEGYVDQLGVLDSIFEKIRMLIDNLPKELRPRGYRSKIHAPFMKIVNPETGSTITGEAGNNIGRGGRKSIYFLDEAAHVEQPELIEASLSANTNVRIDISSVKGVGNVFYRSRMSGTEWEPDLNIRKGKLRVLILDWRDHPNKNDEWYKREKESFAERGLQHIFAQEVDRDYAASVKGVLIPAAWVRAAINAHVKLGIEPSGVKVAGQDAADGGEDASALAVLRGVVVESLSVDHRGADRAAPAMLLTASMVGVEEYWYESVGVGTGVKVASAMMKDVLKGMRVIPWVPNAKVVDPRGDIIANTKMGDADRKTNKDYFANYKSQSSWALRLRFQRTYKWVVEGEPQDPDEIISIPADIKHAQQLEAELSQPTYDTNGAGKIIINKKPSGTKSPNLFDSLVIAASPKQLQHKEAGFEGGLSTVPTPNYESIY